jgi:hypothetical protein
LLIASSKKPAAGKVRSRLFRLKTLKIAGGIDICLHRNKYNPFYNLQSMILCAEAAILTLRGNMATKNEGHTKEIQAGQSTGVRGAIFEIRIKGHLDDSWSDWLGGLEVKLLDNGEMILSGQIGDQAALMGVLNKLYGLNLVLLSVSEVHPKK